MKTELDKSKAICRLCKMEVKYFGNTTNLRNHLTRHHPDTQSAKTSDPNPKKQTQLEQAFGFKLASNSPRAQKITEAVATFICKDIRPYSVVENDGFRSLINILEPRYVLPTRKHLSEVAIPNLYADVKHGVATSHKSAERVALTCDSWTSRATDSYLTITSHYIRGVPGDTQPYTISTMTGDSCPMFYRLGQLKLATRVGVNKDPAIVTDNAANMVHAVELMALLHIGCFAHTINLASQAALKVPAVARLLG
ncbi:Zinc finger BED domain-containing protein 1 [Merluccius polli]|uniref:Zinc finger BED domain-containing protein 1 n=1 Tax=Merluccius polli TaxID=89951 RepID=A0AA47MJ00_MERPO|nr:Zinc finger BED domain-containing protein 1 [Merluccius polli]